MPSAVGPLRMTVMASKPKRWRWLVAILLVVSFCAGLLWVQSSRKSVLERAEMLQVGQPISEVERLMGGKGHVLKVGLMREIRLFGLEQTMQLYAVEAKTAMGIPLRTAPAIDDWPVVVHFDPRDGRVFRIKKGDTWSGTASAP